MSSIYITYDILKKSLLHLILESKRYHFQKVMNISNE